MRESLDTHDLNRGYLRSSRMSRYFHVWFTTKRKKHFLIDVVDRQLHGIIWNICIEKRIELLAYETMPDHVHLLIGANSLKDLMNSVKKIKGISSRRLSLEFRALKWQCHINNIWAKGYGYREIPDNQIKVVIGYIKNQRKHLFIAGEYENTSCKARSNTHELIRGYCRILAGGNTYDLNRRYF